MYLHQVVMLLNCEILSCKHKLDHKVERICASELMSNVLVCTGANSLLLTGLNNVQVIRTAEMSDIPCVVFVQGKKPEGDIIKLAEENGIVILVTDYSLFKACGVLYDSGMRCVIDDACR